MDRDEVRFGVLGPVTAERATGGTADDRRGPIALKGPRHRAVLARLIVARRRVVPVARLVADLWADPPPGAVGAVQTFVADLRRALEPGRPPRAPARLLVTEGSGYALRASPDAVDAWRFETAVGEAAELPATRALPRLDEALELWRGPAYTDFEHEQWVRGERARLAELRLRSVERRAGTQLALGRAAEAVPDLDAHLADHPWREEAWRLLALALYRTDRQGDALAVLRRARSTLVEQLGVDPGPGLRRLEADILAQDPALRATAGQAGQAGPTETAARLWTRAAAAYDRTVAAGARARLETTVGLLRDLAVTGGGGLAAVREHRMAAVAAAEEFGDPVLTGRVIGAFDVPAIWTRGDDPELARQIVAAAERTLAALPPPGGSGGSRTYDTDGSYGAVRCRLLATVAVETRGSHSSRGPQAASQAEAIARRLDDPALLAFALNGAFMQSFTRAGLAPRRAEIGAELVELGSRHGLVTYEVLGRLIGLQAHGALGDFRSADAHATAADRLAARHELPLVGVFTRWYGALRLAASGDLTGAGRAYESAAADLPGAGMPGLTHGLLPLALLSLHLADGPRVPPRDAVDPAANWGPYRPWIAPLAALASGDRAAARTALRALPDPPRDLLYEACCCLEATAALELGDRAVLVRARERLLPASAELAGAGSGLLTLGPVSGYLSAITAALRD
ncbi:AfsR/SARP family transcriptional regulator [Streptomyces sp. IB2014 016-6]|uniref:AfsR/SARP family transcriptional regulator n=1 Tax=Streptomyces sp. IB2014 016-6 TaxID=2517818 RepID=UPI0011C996E9|nr:AfsR/SARP family transcriptional regulator [Streptomyces sp. IB2014 016-6]TXL85359.1 SARP family transcriptional regulator [Streptomyces sp. IB2014 016-6]